MKLPVRSDIHEPPVCTYVRGTQKAASQPTDRLSACQEHICTTLPVRPRASVGLAGSGLVRSCVVAHNECQGRGDRSGATMNKRSSLRGIERRTNIQMNPAAAAAKREVGGRARDPSFETASKTLRHKRTSYSVKGCGIEDATGKLYSSQRKSSTGG